MTRLTDKPDPHFGPSDPPTVHVRMLGGLDLRRDGALVTTLPHGRSRSLLKLLLLRRQRPLGRTRLCTLFWPEMDAASARNSLNATVHRLRRSLDGVLAVRHVADGYQLGASGPIWLDVEQFLLHADLGMTADSMAAAAQAISHYELAAELYRSDLADDGDHEQALASDTQALRDRLNQVLERLAVLREQGGDLHGCLRTGLRHLGLDDCNEAAHRRLMRCYAGLGQLQLAEAQYRNCVAALRTRLALSPSQDTTALYRQLVARIAA